MTEVLELKRKQLVEFANKSVQAKKSDDLEKWIDDLDISLSRMDESEFAGSFLHNLQVFCGLTKEDRKSISDRVVVNTEYYLCQRLKELMGARRCRLQDIRQVPVEDTLTSKGKWLWRSYRGYVKENLHSYQVQFVADKHPENKSFLDKLDEVEMAICG